MEFGLVVVWLALYVGLGLSALPAASLLFESLEDRGAGLAIPLSFAVTAIAAYWIGQVRFGLPAAIGAVSVLLALSGVALWWGVTPDLGRFRDAVIVFALAYLLLILIRAFKPGVWPGGGEKFLDFGLLASLLRSTSLPPQDMWFANEPVRYYYGGHMLAAVFALLTDTAPRYAYNTALAGYYAAYVTAAWGVAGAIASGMGRSYRIGGGLAAFFVGIASNLSTPVRLLVWILPDGLGGALADIAGLEVRGLAIGPLEFDYWLASRVIEWQAPGGQEWNLITEFPFFAFLNGDLHAHMMGPVFLLLGVGIAYAYWRTPQEELTRRRLLLFGALPLVAGLLVVVNTWSFPTLLGVAWLTAMFAPAPPWDLLPGNLSSGFSRRADGDWRFREVGRIGLAVGVAFLVGVLALLVAFPFLSGAASGRGVGFLPEPRSGLSGLLLVHGSFLVISAAYLEARTDRAPWAVIAAGVAVLLALSLLLQAAAVALFVPLLAAAWYLLRSENDVGFETVLLVGVMGLLLLVEVVYVVEQAGPGRHNTVFKVYAQVWALWAVGAGAMAAWFVSTGRRLRRHVMNLSSVSQTPSGSETAGETRTPQGSTDGPADEDLLAGITIRTIGTVLLVVGLVLLSVYAAFGVGWAIHSGTDTPTLDAHSYIGAQHPEEAAAIEWLASLEGQPTMVSAPGVDIYRWVNAPSSMTGIPTVAGWSHEIGYRGDGPYLSRVQDVEIVFETNEAMSRATILRKYDVEYVYVGPIERERYDPGALDTEPGITVAYADDHVSIYRVNTSELTAG